MMGYGAGMWGFDWVFMLLFWVFLVAGTVWLVLTLTRSQSQPPSEGDAALRILQERLARGEIDIEEFKERRAALSPGRYHMSDDADISADGRPLRGRVPPP